MSAKKKRQNDDDSIASPSKAVFRFAATLEKKDHGSIKDALDKVGQNTPKSDPKLLKRILDKPGKTPTKTPNKTPNKNVDSAKRYKVISEARGIDPSEFEDDSESERLYKLVDLIKDEEEKAKNERPLDMPSLEAEPVDQITCNGVPLVKLAEEEYVYDVYTMQSDAFSSTDSEQSFNAQDFDAVNIVDISFLDCRDIADDEEAWRKVMDGDDSDSNDEDHWRNDYPDEEDEFSDDDENGYRDDDLDLDFDNFHLKHGNREIASSPDASDEDDYYDEDDDEEGLIHSRDETFERDADLHGTSYAKWKRQMVKEMGDDEDYFDDDINEVDEF